MVAHERGTLAGRDLLAGAQRRDREPRRLERSLAAAESGVRGSLAQHLHSTCLLDRYVSGRIACRSTLRLRASRGFIIIIGVAIRLLGGRLATDLGGGTSSHALWGSDIVLGGIQPKGLALCTYCSSRATDSVVSANGAWPDLYKR